MTTEKASSSFFFPAEWEDLGGPEEQIEKSSAPVKSISLAFKQNLLGTVATLSMPFLMVFASINRRRFQGLLTAETIRARAHLQDDGTVPRWAQQKAIENATQQLNDELEDVRTHGPLSDQIKSELVDNLVDERMRLGSVELLRQGVILTWGCLEVFARDLFVTLVNSRHELARKLVESDETRQLFQMKN